MFLQLLSESHDCHKRFSLTICDRVLPCLHNRGMQSSLLSWLRPSPTDDRPTTRATTSRAPVPCVTSEDPSEPDDSANGPPSSKVFGEPLHLTFKPPFGPSHALSACASIVPFGEQHVAAYKRLNAVILPVPYGDKFYREALEDEIARDITRVVMWRDQPAQPTPGAKGTSDQTGKGTLVAGVRCRLLSSIPGVELPDAPMLYISTIGTLAPFRTHSLATHLLSEVALTAMRKYGATTIVAHTWEANEDGIEWYKRRGFRVLKREEQYYRRLHPRSAALVMIKELMPSDLVSNGRGKSLAASDVG